MTLPFTWKSLTGFKGRLYALVGVSVLALVLFGSVAIYGIRDGLSSLSDVYLHQVKPAAALHEMEDGIKDVRFRLTGYLLDQMPAVGNIIHLHEARDKAILGWLRFRETTENNSFDDSERAHIAKIEKNLGNIDAVFSKLEQGYRNDD